MKTKILKLSTVKKIILSLMIIIPVISFAQEEATWDFPVKPGTEEWKALKNQKEKLDVCHIPDDILKIIPTSELMEICFNYPLIYDILAFNSTQQGIEQLKKNFNGFNEFVNRPEAAELLLKKYSNLQPQGFNKDWTDIEKGYFSLEFIATELFLSQHEIISKLSSLKKKQLTKELLKKLEEKNDKQLYGGLSQMSIGFALVRIMQYEGYDIKEADPMIKKEIENLMIQGNLKNVQILPNILYNAYEFIK